MMLCSASVPGGPDTETVESVLPTIPNGIWCGGSSSSPPAQYSKVPTVDQTTQAEEESGPTSVLHLSQFIAGPLLQDV